MSVTSLLLLAAIFIAVFGSSMLVLVGLPHSRSQQRLRALAADPSGATAADPAASGNWIAGIAKMSGPLARLSVPSEGIKALSLRARFAQAGLRGTQVMALFFAAKTLMVAVAPLLLWLFITVCQMRLQGNALLVGMLAAAAAGYYLPNVALARAIRQRQRQIFESLPDALDLMTVCIEAGISTDAAIARVAHEMSSTAPALSEELHLAMLELRAGNSREQALRNLGARVGVGAVESLATILIQAEQYGTSIGDALRVHAEHLRTKRRQMAEECAAKVALKLLMPLVFCIFPALILIMLGPSFLQISRVLLPSLAGQ